MAYSSVTYTGDGSTRVYSIPFPFLSRDCIHVFLRRKGEAEAFEIGSHELEWPTEATLRLPQPAPEAGDVITIRRITDRDTTFVDFRDGSALPEEERSAQSRQRLHIRQEAFDALSTGTAASADVSCQCATQSKHYSEEARRQARTASNAAAEATEQADRAEQAADDAEAAALYAERANRRFGVFTVKHADKLALAPNGFYIIWGDLPVCCTDSLPLKPHDCKSGEDVPMNDGFYLCVPGPTRPTTPEGPGGIPGGGADVTICGARKSFIVVTPKS